MGEDANSPILDFENDFSQGSFSFPVSTQLILDRPLGSTASRGDFQGFGVVRWQGLIQWSMWRHTNTTASVGKYQRAYHPPRGFTSGVAWMGVGPVTRLVVPRTRH